MPDLVACCSLFLLTVQHHGQLLVSKEQREQRAERERARARARARERER